ncbi:hypothetical protein K8P63_20340 [Sphingomonas nostoxanthinifaciens]|nr:hypothetical protein K8P63_20340 [Sphingomonas nostoxanthinifaciens]
MLAEGGSLAARWLGPVISLGIFAAVLWQLRTMHIAQVVDMVPRSPLFWLVFAGYYLVTPAADFLIFRRLWNLPAAGFGALTRKFVGNEILMGYIGELHFYSWARNRLRMVAAPFAAVKDVAILSAAAGNLVTLAVLAAAYPFLGALHLGLAPGTIVMAVTVTLGTSLVLLAFRGRLLTLDPTDLMFVGGVQLLRVVVTSLLPALLWHLVLPQVALGWWLLLASLRLLLSRLPLLPNKDLVFAGIAVVLVGPDVAIGGLMTMMASLILATHILVGAGLVLAEFALGED